MGRRASVPQINPKTGRLNTYSERVRSRIKVGQAVSYLTKCVKGEEDACPHRIAAAKILINKVIPDEIEMIKAETARMAAARGARAITPKDVSHASPHDLLRVIEGQAERTDQGSAGEQVNGSSGVRPEK